MYPSVGIVALTFTFIPTLEPKAITDEYINLNLLVIVQVASISNIFPALPLPTKIELSIPIVPCVPSNCKF